MSIRNDARVLYHLAFSSRGRCESHQDRMEQFYRGQAEDYDAFRMRLLQGRTELFAALDIPKGGVWADLGGGTGASLKFLGDRVHRLGKGYIVDLCPSLLARAREHIAARGWTHIEAAEADVCAFQPAEGALDAVTFSYSLTMIPDWFKALDHAYALLKPGGIIGVVDFYVSRKHPPEGLRRHGAATRFFWPAWFSIDNVFVNEDHIPYLLGLFERVKVEERRARVPYLPGLRVPYYLFVGRKPAGEESAVT